MPPFRECGADDGGRRPPVPHARARATKSASPSPHPAPRGHHLRRRGIEPGHDGLDLALRAVDLGAASRWMPRHRPGRPGQTVGPGAAPRRGGRAGEPPRPPELRQGLGVAADVPRTRHGHARWSGDDPPRRDAHWGRGRPAAPGYAPAQKPSTACAPSADPLRHRWLGVHGKEHVLGQGEHLRQAATPLGRDRHDAGA